MDYFISEIEMDISTMCRLCFSRLRKPRSIFDTPDLLDRILNFTDIEINLEDDLPKQICDICNAKLEMTEEFRRQIREADDKIKTFVATRRASLSNESKAIIVEPSAEPEGSGDLVQDSKPFLYTDSPVSSIVECYDILINECRLHSSLENPEDFILPSSFACIRRDEMKEENSVVAISTGAIANDWLSDCQPQNLIPGILAADPLNLLKVKSVQPLNNSDLSGRNSRSVSSSPSFPFRGRRKLATRFPNSKIAKINPKISENSVESLASASSPSCSSFFSLSSEHDNRSNSILTSSKRLPSENNSFRQNNIRGETTGEKLIAKCPICYKICASVHGIQVHIGIVHKSENCQLCGTPMRTKLEFKKHMQLHMLSFDNRQGKSETIQCDTCKREFKNKAGLAIHVRTHTRTTLPFSRKRYVPKKPRSIL